MCVFSMIFPSRYKMITFVLLRFGFPDGMESVSKKSAITKRNDWMIQQSGFMVSYVHKITGGAAKFREKAEK